MSLASDVGARGYAEHAGPDHVGPDAAHGRSTARQGTPDPDQAPGATLAPGPPAHPRYWRRRSRSNELRARRHHRLLRRLLAIADAVDYDDPGDVADRLDEIADLIDRHLETSTP